jgi:hypothetical protein
MRRICAPALFAVITTVITTIIAAGAQAQTTPEQTAHRRQYGTIPSPTRHLGEIRPNQNRLGTLRGPQGSLIKPSPMPYLGGSYIMQGRKQPAPAIGPQSQLQLQGSSQPPSTTAEYAPIDRPNGSPQRIVSCWSPPGGSSDDVEVTVRLSFSRTGDIVGQPRITYVKAGSDDTLRRAISASILTAIQSCVPLRFTPGLGQAIAGRSFAIRFIAPAVRKPAASI